MRPIRIDFGAFGPYAGEEHIDFEKLSSKGVFLICGETGSGKTMMLDAMTFALYGMSSGNVRDDFESMRCTNADFDATTYVKFTFEVNSEVYIFERRLERKRKNLSKSYNMMKQDEDGVFRVLLENPKERDLNKKAAELIGLEYNQFKQVIILPQGQFEKLLTCPSDEKEKILTNIFGEDKWQKIADKMYEDASGKRDALKIKRDTIAASLKEEDCESIEQLSLLIQVKDDEVQTLEDEYKKTDYDAEIKRLNDMLILSKRFGDLDKAKDSCEKLKARRQERDQKEESLNNAKRAENVRNFLEAEETAVAAVDKRTADLKNSEKALEDALSNLENISKEISRHLEGDAANENNKRIKLAYENKTEDYSSIEKSREEYELKTADFEKADKVFKNAANEQEKCSDRLKLRSDEYSESLSEHRKLYDAYISGITGELAKDLEEGVRCPVCGSTHHPEKAEVTADSVSREAVDAKETEVTECKEKADIAEKLFNDAKLKCEKCKNDFDKAREEMLTAKAAYEVKTSGLIEGIENLEELNNKIKDLDKAILKYSEKKEELADREKILQAKNTEAKTRKENAAAELKSADETLILARKELEDNLKKNGFESVEEARYSLLGVSDMNNLQKEISEYDTMVLSSQNAVKDLEGELEGKERPDETLCRENLDKANSSIRSYTAKRAELESEKNRLLRKETMLKSEGEGIEEKIRIAESDWAFAKKLRGDSGTGLQRYVLGIMFSTVIEAANKMLELVHDGRYRLFRSDDRASGTIKRGLELKVYDKYSDDLDGRFVTTLSGGEKFLVSLALSIGMSTVAQRGGVKIEALFIDEGFGTLDENSIVDAMNILSSIRESNALVGIISHVQILQERIATKLVVCKNEGISHISETIG